MSTSLAASAADHNRVISLVGVASRVQDKPFERSRQSPQDMVLNFYLFFYLKLDTWSLRAIAWSRAALQGSVLCALFIRGKPGGTIINRACVTSGFLALRSR